MSASERKKYSVYNDGVAVHGFTPDRGCVCVCPFDAL